IKSLLLNTTRTRRVGIRALRYQRHADRIKGVYLLGSGWPVGRVAQALMVDRESMRNHHKRYRKGGLMALLRKEADGNGPTSMVFIDCNDLSATVRYDDTINAQSIIKRFQQIERNRPALPSTQS